MGADKFAENTPKLICPDFEAFSTRYLHMRILKPRTLFYRTDCTRRSKFLTHALHASNSWFLRHQKGSKLRKNCK